MKKLFILLLIGIIFISCEDEIINEKTVRIEIGNWNMYTQDTKGVKPLMHPFKAENVIDVKCFIYHDNIQYGLSLTDWDDRNNEFKGKIKYIDNQIILHRTKGGFFCNYGYDDYINRGYIILTYK